ncbi:MAG TPA: G8 domain-containing protein, partial [Pirellulales bacterium]|nr:G8 domain-containing protein [Pirellulales bacterium]
MRDLDYRCHFLIEPLERRDALSTVAGGGIVTTVGQVIPNFGANPTDYSMASGNWSNPAIWSAGRVPVAGDVVQIAAGTRINYDANSPAVIATVAVEPGGELDFATSVSTRLVVGNLLVMEGGTLTIGTPTNPVAGNVRAEVDFSGSLNKTADPQQYGIGLIGLGTVIVCGSPLSQTWLPLANEPKAGDTALALSAPVSGWRPGDTLLIPDSREMNEASLNPYVWEGDMPTIAAVSQDGRTVTLAAPLKYSHPGAHDAAGLLDDTPGVADLSRNVVFKSIGGTPGHVMFVDRAAVDVAFAELDGLGRTTVQPLGSTNIRDRDAIDLDNLMGPAAGQVGGGAGGQREFQFQLTGCVVNGSPKIGIALQNASFGLLSGNVVFNADGAGIMLEDGGEVQNTIAGNFTGLNVGDNRAVYQGADTGDFGHEGVGFWFRDQDNYVTGNVATDARHADFTISEQPGAPAGSRSVPSFVAAQPDFPGANLADPSQTTLVDVNSQGVLEFAGNEAYGGNTSFGGLYLWQAGIDVGQAPALTKVPMSTIQGFVAWNVAKGINS